MGLTDLIFIAAIVGGSALAVVRSKRVIALVVTTWRATTEPDADGYFVRITGRPQGVWAFIKNAIGLSRPYELMISNRDVAVRRGAEWVHVPLAGVSSIRHGRTWPWAGAIVVGIIVTLITAVALLLKGHAPVSSIVQFPLDTLRFVGFSIPLAVGGAAGVAYFLLNRTLYIGVVESGGSLHQLCFKPSLLDGQRLDDAKAAQAVEIACQLVLNRRAR